LTKQAIEDKKQEFLTIH